MLRAIVVEYENRPNRCTVCPEAPAREELTTAWITADTGDFYCLAQMR